MRLSELVSRVEGGAVAGDGDPEIRALVCDSRKAGPGALFAALPGAKTDGGRFAAEAVAAGAVAVLAAADAVPAVGVPVLRAPDARKALAEAADAFFGSPSRRLALMGVTGTNGKTTTAFLVRHLAEACGRKAGLLGTIRYETGARSIDAPLTTPDCLEFTACLAEMVDAGLEVAAVEVSSHALDQWRVWPHRFACAAFTNLTRDHLDYHGTMEAYLAAKKRLFDHLPPEAAALVNLRDPAWAPLTADTRARVLRYGTASDAELRAEVLAAGLSGTELRLSWEGGTHRAFTPLVGAYNVENTLAAFGCACSLGCDPAKTAAALASFPGVPGRLERIVGRDGRTGFVDYAHTDDALRSVLAVLRPLVPGRILTVFGCGGDRDRGKRPLMARAVEAGADLAIVTSDNPRTEDPARIIRDIVAGFSNPQNVLVVPDRREAVRQAARLAGATDVILLAGKGHEATQIVGTVKHPCDDRELLREALAEGNECA